MEADKKRIQTRVNPLHPPHPRSNLISPRGWSGFPTVTYVFLFVSQRAHGVQVGGPHCRIERAHYATQ